MPYIPQPTMGTFFTTSMVINIIKSLQHRKSMNRTRLRAGHIIYTTFLTLCHDQHFEEDVDFEEKG